MALIQNNSATNVDVEKLKRELEQLSISGRPPIKVLGITPLAQGVIVSAVFSTPFNGSTEIEPTDTTTRSAIQATVASSSSAQRRKIIVNDKPGFDDEAGNKDYIDDEIDAHILELIGTAPDLLNTLGEIADALKGRVSEPITENVSVAVGGSGTKTLTVDKYVSTILSIKNSAGNEISLVGVTKANNVITLPSSSTLAGTASVTYRTVGGPAEDFGKYVVEWLQNIDRQLASIGLYSSTVQFGTDPTSANDLNIITETGYLDFITEPSAVDDTVSPKQITVSATITNVVSITDSAGLQISLVGVTASAKTIKLPLGSTLTGSVVVRYTTPESTYGKTFVLNVPNASNTVRGVITAGTQTIGGAKTFTKNIKVNDVTVGTAINVTDNTADNSSVAIGRDTLKSQTTNNLGNTAVGDSAGKNITSGLVNTLVGSYAGYSITTGEQNTFVGETTGESVTSGKQNTIVGQATGSSMSTGSQNTVVGQGAAIFITTGIRNTIVGSAAGGNIKTTASKNTFIGYGAGSSLEVGSNNVIIGGYTALDAPQDGSGYRTLNNTIVLSDGAGTERLRVDSLGNVLVGTTGVADAAIAVGDPDAKLTVVHSGSNDAVRITQTGAGNALVVEDSSNPDSTPFVVTASGNVGIGTKTPAGSYALDISGAGFISRGASKVLTDTVSSYALDIGSGVTNALGFISRGFGNVVADRPSNYAMSVRNTSINGFGLIIDQAIGSYSLAVRDNTPTGSSPNGTYRHKFHADGSLQIGGFPDANQTNNPPVYAIQVNTSGNTTATTTTTFTGNVGIGTTTPTSALQVSGAVQETPTASGVHLGLATGYACVELAEETGGLIDFTTPGNNTKGRIIYKHSTASATEDKDSMAFATNGSEKVRILSSGNVGIGTTTPASKLEIKDTTNAELTLRVHNAKTSDTTGRTNISLVNDAGTIAGLRLNSSNNADATFNGGNGLSIWQSASAPVSIYTNSLERVRIDSSGNVGIGTTSPHLSNYPSASGVLTVKGWAGGAGGAGALQGLIEIVGDRPDANAAAAGDINVFANSNTTNKRIAQIQFRTDGTTANNRGGKIVFATKQDNSATFVESLVINNAGSVSISSQVQDLGGFTHMSLGHYSDNYNGPSIDLVKSRGTTIGANGKVSVGDALFTAQFYGNTGNGNARAAYIQAIVDGSNSGAVSGTSMPGAFIFATTPNGSTSTQERVRIASSGNVGIGTASPVCQLDVTGQIRATSHLTTNQNLRVDGKVHIGIESAQTEKLYVNGDIKSTNNITTDASVIAISGIKASGPGSSLKVLDPEEPQWYEPGQYYVRNGVKICWNDTDGSGKTSFINGRGLGTGGYEFKTVANDLNSTSGGNKTTVATIEPDGILNLYNNSIVGPGIKLKNTAKTAIGALWAFYNMQGTTYGNSMQLWRYPASGDGAPTTVWGDDGHLQHKANLSVDGTFTGTNINIGPDGNLFPNKGQSHRISGTGNQPVLSLETAETAYEGSVLRIGTNRSDSGDHNFIICYAGAGAETLPKERFRVTNLGGVYAGGATSLLAADYAELFEWEDGNALGEDRRGYTVSLSGTKIKICDTSEEPIGVVSSTPCIIADSAWNEWSGKYLKDEFGNIIRETYSVYEWEENGKTHTYEISSVPEDVVVPENCTVSQKTRDVLNPEYDPTLPYVPREKRKEWSPIGLVGKLRVRKGQVVGSRWIKLRDISDTVEEWLVR